ncbi:hypothetical protein GQ600_7778 [Phytophthora cactorum]|nr:hypothetical protein GQ600_7778 [Phytophthora cactorum]
MVLHKQQVTVEKVENTPPAERRVQGIRLTHYDGSLAKALELFLDQLIGGIKEMGDLDKIALFTRGLVTQTRVYHRCSTTSYKLANLA